MGSHSQSGSNEHNKVTFSLQYVTNDEKVLKVPYLQIMLLVALKLYLTLNVQLLLLKSTENPDIDWCKDVKGNMYDMVVEGFQLLSKWTARIWEQCAWKFSRPCKDVISLQSHETSSFSDYEKVINFHFSSNRCPYVTLLFGMFVDLSSLDYFILFWPRLFIFPESLFSFFYLFIILFHLYFELEPDWSKYFLIISAVYARLAFLALSVVKIIPIFIL